MVDHMTPVDRLREAMEACLHRRVTVSSVLLSQVPVVVRLLELLEASHARAAVCSCCGDDQAHLAVDDFRRENGWP